MENNEVNLNSFSLITLYLWDFIFSIINKNEIKILRIVCKDFRNISTNYWFQNISHKEINNYFIKNQKFNFNIRFIILQNEQFDLKKLDNNNDLLLISCEYGYLEIIKLLLKNGANVNEKDKYNTGLTLLMKASIYGHLEIVKLLIQNYANINEKNVDGWSSLMVVSMYGKLKIANFLLQNCADINQRDNNGLTSLMYASIHKNFEIVKLLVENGANINIKDNNGYTALLHACLFDNIETVKLLIENGSDINEKDNNGRSFSDIVRKYKIF